MDASLVDVTLSRMRPAIFVACAILCASSVAAQPVDRWEKDIAAFEAADKMTPPQKGGIVFVGSSTIRRWDTAAYFPDLKIINRGFGGSEMADAVTLRRSHRHPLRADGSSWSIPATTTSAPA